MRVKVYKNLHKDCYSVVNLATGRVCDHSHAVVLYNAEFRVSEKGRQRVLRTKQKNVHAYVVGVLASMRGKVFPDYKPKIAYYNPYKTKTFVNKRSKKPILKAKVVALTNKIYYW